MNPSASPVAEPRYGWVMVAVGTTMLGFNFGALASITVFLKPLSEEFGWMRGDTAFAYTAGTLSIGLAGIFWARLADRRSTRLTVLIGSAAQGLAFYLLSLHVTLWQFYLLFCLLGGLGFAAVNVPIIANVGQWFSAHKGLALGLVSAGGALGQGLVPFLARYLITVEGWRMAYLHLAVLYWICLLPLAVLVRRPPPLAAPGTGGGAAATDGAEPPPALATREVVTWLSVAVIFCCICMAVAIVHLVSLLTDKGFAPQTAAGLFTAVMVAGLFGRILIGRLADAIGGLGAYMAASAVQTVLVFWFVPLQGYLPLLALAVVFGLGFSGVMTSIWVCVREMVPPRVGAVSLAVVVLFAWIGMGLGGWQGGYLFDHTGDYRASFALAALAGVVNLAILGALWLRLNRGPARLAPESAG